MNDVTNPFFAPQLYIKSGVKNIDFYTKAFGAIELRRWSNDDGSVHVVKLSIEGAIFHLHEEKVSASQFAPQRHNGTTVLIGLFVPAVDAVMKIGSRCIIDFTRTGL